MTDASGNEIQRKTFRQRVIDVLESRRFHIAVIILVIFDCVLVVCELLFDLEHMEEIIHEKESIASEVLHYLSAVVLGLFILEIIVKLYAYRLKFFRHKLEVFDAAIVIISLVLDLTYSHIHSAMHGLGFLILFRLWRITRIVNGMIVSVQMRADDRLHEELHAKELLERYCAEQETEIEALRALLFRNKITDTIPRAERQQINSSKIVLISKH